MTVNFPKFGCNSSRRQASGGSPHVLFSSNLQCIPATLSQHFSTDNCVSLSLWQVLSQCLLRNSYRSLLTDSSLRPSHVRSPCRAKATGLASWTHYRTVQPLMSPVFRSTYRPWTRCTQRPKTLCQILYLLVLGSEALSSMTWSLNTQVHGLSDWHFETWKPLSERSITPAFCLFHWLPLLPSWMSLLGLHKLAGSKP